MDELTQNTRTLNLDSITDRKIARTQNTVSGLTHECGVFGLIADTETDGYDIAQLICIGLEALQHRGQESTGIVTSTGSNNFHVQKGMGLVRNVFNNENIKKLVGHIGIGHTRYSTSAASEQVNCQPFVVHSMHGSLAIGHNGELVNSGSLRKMVLDRGVGLSTHSDSELITQALCLIPPDGEVNGPDWPARIRHLMKLAPLSYSLVFMLKDRIYAVRDPYGNRPLCLGRIQPPQNGHTGSNGTTNGHHHPHNPSPATLTAWAVSSESCAFLPPLYYHRELQPGEIVELTAEHGVRTIDVVPTPAGRDPAFCIFEYVYFARPNSRFEGQEVYAVRIACGAQLAGEHPVVADVVGSVPESGNAAAFGYAKQSNIPLGELLCKNTYVGRTFIQPSTRLRQLNVALKFSPISCNVKNKRIILIDDSIVRGNTIGQIIKLLRKAGATEVHVRVASPPLLHPCYMGINIPTRKELIANSLDSKKLAKEVGADSLEYLSVEGLVKAVQRDVKTANGKVGHCTACLTGEYPGGLPDDLECRMEELDELGGEVTVVDVYDIASDIGKECEKIIDQYGADAVTALMPKLINALELLENLATKNEWENTALAELKSKISQLENDKIEKAEYREKFDKELEAIEDQWRTESKELIGLVSRLQEENRRLVKENDGGDTVVGVGGVGGKQPLSPTETANDGVMLEKLRQSLERQRDELRDKDRMLQDKSSDLDSLRVTVDRLTGSGRELRRKQKSLQTQVRTLCDERADFLVQMQDQHRDISALRQRLGLAQKENEDLTKTDVSYPSNKAIYDLDDPNRPRFTTAELKDILHERNELKARVSDLEDELDTYRPKKPETLNRLDYFIERFEEACSTVLPDLNFQSIDVNTPLDEDAPVQGPLPYEPDDAPWKRTSESGIRKFFRKIFSEGSGGGSGSSFPRRSLSTLSKMALSATTEPIPL